jgi:polysaccharide biosynthesis transport protein
VSPNTQRMAAMGLILGLLAGLGLAVLFETLDHHLRSPDEVAAVLPVPIIGLVHEYGPNEDRAKVGRWVLDHPRSRIAEVYRTVRTGVYFGLPKERSKLLLVTSGFGGEGKTTLSSNLAITMAQAGQKTLIIDADFRKARQHLIHSLSNAQGLSSVIAGRCETDKAIQSTDIKNLYLLPEGPVPPNPDELFNSQSFADMLERLRTEFDNIVIDSPPILVVSDARNLAARVDATILVIRLQSATRRSILDSVQAIQSVGGQVLGAVVNGVPKGSRGYGYGYEYGYTNGDGYYDDEVNQTPRGNRKRDRGHLLDSSFQPPPA